MDNDNEQVPLSHEPLPFGKPKQEALLGYVLTNDRFFEQVRYQIKPAWFIDPRCSQVYDALIKESVGKGRKLKPEELKECHPFMKVDNKERAILCSTINRAISRTADFDLDSITPELSDWLKARVYMEKVYKSSDLFNSSRSSLDSVNARVRRNEAYSILNEMSRHIEEISFDGAGEVEFNDIQQDIIGYEASYQDALPFGSATLDRLLLPEANGKGSLLRGDMTVLLGPVNAGKTSCMITTLAANLCAGKNAILIPHEGRPDDLKLKLIQCLSGSTKRELFYAARDPNLRKQFAEIEALLHDHLVYMPMIQAGLTVEEFGSTVRRAIDRFMAKHNGASIDLVVDDYLALLTSVQNARGQLQKRERDSVVYQYGSTLAGECKFHLLTGIQGNREANKINKRVKGAADRLLVPEDSSESFGPAMVATNIITLNRSPMAQIKNRVTFLICKSRSSETNIAVVCGSKYACCITHKDELGCAWYKGLSTMDQRIDDLMVQYKNAEIPELLVLKADDGG